MSVNVIICQTPPPPAPFVSQCKHIQKPPPLASSAFSTNTLLPLPKLSENTKETKYQYTHTHMWLTLCFEQWAEFCVECSVFKGLCAVFCFQCFLCSLYAKCFVCIVLCAVYCVQCVVCIVQCSVCCVQCVVCNSCVHFVVCTVLCLVFLFSVLFAVCDWHKQQQQLPCW